MAVKYYSDGTYTKGDGKLYRPGIGVVGNDKSTTVSKAESGTSTPTTNKTTTSETGSTLTTMRGTGSGSKSYTDTLKENITNSVNNPSNGIYTSLGNNSVMKDMITAYNYSTGSNAKGPSTSSKTVVEEELIEEPYNPYEELEAKLQAYKEQQEAQIREQNRLAVEQGKNRLNAQKANINQAADENARQAYVQYMQSQKALPQQLASQGVSGGATETANLGLQTAYQNNVNAINQNKANRLQEIDNAIVDLQNTGDLSTVEQVLANNQAALDAYMNTFDKGVSYNQWANQFNANRQDTLADQAYRDKVYKDQMIQQEWENDWFEKKYNYEKEQAELDRVLQGYYNGNYDIGYTSAQTGIPEEYLYDTKSERELMAKLERANTQSLISNRNSGGSSGGTKTPSKTEVFNDALAMSKAEGWTADDVIRFVMGQGLSEVDEMTVLQNLGLLTNTPVETITNISHGGSGRGF